MAADDQSTITGTSTGTVTEDQYVQANGKLVAHDVDAQDHTHFVAQQSAQGQYGTFNLSPDGSWDYLLTSQKLTSADTVTEHFMVHTSDGTQQEIVVTVKGHDDQAHITGFTTGAVTEDGKSMVSDQLYVVDQDAQQDHFTSQTDTPTQYGHFSITEAGLWTFTLDNTNPKVQALSAGQQTTEVITVTSADGTQKQVTVTINGTDDQSTITGTSTGTVTEDQYVQANGKLVAHDVDAQDHTHFVAQQSAQGQYGTFNLSPDGSWDYLLTSQKLTSADTVTEHFMVHTSDGTQQEVVVTVKGHDDQAHITGFTTGAVTEDGQSTVSDQLYVADQDAQQDHFTAQMDTPTQYGHFSITEAGLWTFTLDNTNPTVQALGKGVTATDTITVHSADGTPHQVTITVNGTNDVAIIGGTNSGAVTEESKLQTSGTLTVTDVDTGEAHFSNTDIVGSLGTLHLTDSGSWTYDLDNTNPTVQALGKGATATDTITVHSADGTPHQVIITVNGTNDAAVISGDTVKSIHENALFDADKHDVTTRQNAHSLSGALTSQDVDSGQSNLFQPIHSQMGHYGSISLDANGHWHYQLAPSEGKTIDELAQGEHVTEVFTVKAIDGTSQTISIEIIGDNDSASITLQPSRSHTTVFEDKISDIDTSGALRAYGNVDVTDVDNQGSTTHSEELLKSETAHTAIGGVFTVHGTSWDYQVDPNNSKVQALAAGEKLVETHTITSIDGTASKQVSVTIVGTNDAAVITGTDTGDVTEGNAGQHMSPDYAQPGMAFLGRSTIHTTGKLNITDVDTGEAEFDTHGIGFTYSGQYGDLLLNKDGSWSYHADTGQIRSTGGLTSTRGTTIDQLGENQTLTDTVTVFTKDGTSHDIVITIHGSNDRPYCASEVQLNSGKEDLAQTITSTELLANTVDVDANDAGQLSITNLHADHGSIRDNNDGTFTFTPDKDYNGQVHFTYDVADAHGGVTHTAASTTLTATTDKAVITDAQTNADLRGVTEDRGYIDTHYKLHYDGKLNIQDPDVGEAQFDPNIGPQTYQGMGYDTKLGGHVWLMQDGSYTYTLDNRNIQNLAQGEVKHDSAVIRSADGTTHTIELTVHGTNDTPVINAQSHSVFEGGSLLNGQMIGHDIDTGATLTYSAPQVDGLVVNPDGTYSFNPNHSSYQSLASGITKTLTVPVTVTDEHNASSTQNLSIIITGVNNSATVSGVDSGDVTEGNAGQHMSPDYAQPGMAFLGRSTIHTTGKLNITDVDTGEAEFDTHGIGFTYSGQYGDLLLNKDGSWSYHADTGQIRSTGGLTSTRGTTIDQLGENQTLTDTVTVFTKDGTSHDIVITIHGSNDRPYCASEVQLNSGKEDLAQTITSTELLANTVDVDANDAGQLSITNLHADHGSIRDNNDGTFTFTPNSDYNGKIQFSYDVKDAHGGVTSTSASLDLAPVDDAAVITGQHAGDITEDNLQSYQSALTVKGHLHVVDPDGGEAQFTSVTKIDDPYNTTQNGLSISPNGAWSYDVNNNLSSVQNMAEGETKDIVYEVQTVDGTKQRITITLHGTNDSPILQFTSYGNASAGSNPISTDEDKAITISIDRFVGAGKDIDHGDTLHIEQLQVDHGKAVLSADGQSVIYTPEKDFNGHATFTYQIADSHGALAINPATGHPGLSGMMIDVNAMPDNAVIGGDITGGVTEDKMMGMALLQAHGTLTITDPDAGEAQFLPNDGVHNNGYETAMGGLVTINPKTGDWSYVVDNFKTEVQSLGATETAVDTVTIHSKDGTAQQIQITIHGVNDNPTVSSVVTLASGTEDTDQTIQASDLLALATDVDKNDAGQLTLGAISVDHGSITDNHDGTYTLHQEANYNGQVSLSYDIKDVHGGSVATSASLQLAAVNDNPDVQPLTDRVIEGATSPHHLDLLAGATDKEGDALNIEQLSFSVDGGKSSQLLPSGLSIAKDGHTLLVDATDPAFNYLNAGQPLNIVASYLVSDGHGGQTQQTAVLTIEGTDDKAVLVSNVIQMSETDALQSEFTRYQGKLQIIDPDTGDNTQFQFGGVYIGQGFPPGELDIWPDGSYSFHLETALNRHADDLVSSLHQGESMEFPYTVKTTDGQTVTIMVKVIGEDSQARIEVGRYSSVDNHVTEDHFTPGSTHNLISSSGHLHVIDPDHDQAGFIAQNINTPEGGHFHINARGSWAYNIDNSKLQHLGAGESYQKTFTVESIDGSAHRDITVTVHGTNDNPVISSAISLPAGVEDTKIILTSPQLLANTTDIDDNDAGQLSIANLQTDHGSILANTNGTFTFTPEANYHGQVKFTYDVKDAHGGITHTSASTTLAAVNDAGVITGDKSGTITEDSHVQGDAQHTIYTVGVLDVTDPDAGENHFHESHNVHALHDPFGGSFTIGKAGDWSYSVPNANVQHLAKDQVETVQYEVITQGGDKQIVTVSIHGTNDDPILSITQTTPVTGTLTETDVDVKDTHSFSVVSPTGQFGDLSVDPTSGAYVYTPNSSVSGMSYNSATHTYHGADVFEVKVADNHGGESSRFVTFDTNGQVNLITGQQPTITTTVPQNPVVTTAQPSLPTSSNTPPSNTVTVDLVASSDSGKSDTDNLTNNNTPTITGHTDVPYSQVTIYDGLTPIGHADI